MGEKKSYIIVKDRHPRISEVLNDCKLDLCVTTYKNEPLSSILQKICNKAASGGGGSVSSIGLNDIPDFAFASGSPVTGSGSFGYVLEDQPANYVFAGPVSGAPDVPTFRPLTIDDLNIPSDDNGLISGGLVTWIQDYQYAVSPAIYKINGVQYSSLYTEVGLVAADPDFDRIDVIAVDVTGQVIVITGEPGDNPQAPSVDPETQLALTFVVVKAGTTQPVVNQEWIYRENIEWTTSVNSGSINPASTNIPYAGSLDVEGTTVLNNDTITFDAPLPVTLTSFNVITFRIRGKAIWNANQALLFRFHNGGVPLGYNVALGEGDFGFGSAPLSGNQYYNVSIPLANFQAGSTVDRLTITMSGTPSIGFYIDDIQLQEAFIPAGVGNFILNQFGFEQDANYRIAGTGKSGKVLIGTSSFSNAASDVLEIRGNTFISQTSLTNAVIAWSNRTLNLDAKSTSGRLLLTASGTGSAFEIQHSRENGQMLSLYNSQNSETTKLRFAAKTIATLTSNIFSSTQGVSGYYFSHNLTNNNTSWFRGDSNRNAYLEFYPHITGTTTSLIKIEGITSTSGSKEIEHITMNARYISPQGNQRVIIGSSTDDGVTPLQIDGIIKARSYGAGVVSGTATYNLLVDANGNVIEGAVPVGGGILGITADNGLTANTLTNVRLGGSLIQDTTITTGLYGLTIDKTTFGTPLTVTNSVDGSAITAFCSLGAAISASADAGTGAIISSNSGIPLHVTAIPSSLTSVVPLVYLDTDSTGTAGDGIGGSIVFRNKTSTTVDIVSNQLISKWSTADHSTRTSQFIITGVNSAVESDLFTLSGTGATRLNKYGVGSFISGTPVYSLVVDASGNIIEASLPSGISGITANNGLTANTSTNVQLGGTLIQNTTVTGGNFTTTFSSTVTGGSNYGFSVLNTSTGNALFGQSSTGVAVTGSGTSSGIGVSASSVTGTALFATVNPSSTNTAVAVTTFRRSTTGTAANGIGGILGFENEYDNGSSSITNELISKWTNVTAASRTSQFIITGVNSAITADLFTLSGSGATRLNKYGLGTFSGTATYALSVDASGNIIETALGGGGDTNFATNDLTATGNRSHDFADLYSLRIGGTTSFDLFVGDIGLAGDFSGVFSAGGVTYLEHFIDSSGSSAVVAVENTLARMQVTSTGDVSTLELTPNTLTINSTNATDMQVFIEDLASAATANVLFYDTTTGQITYGATPGGGGGGTVTSVAASITSGAIAIGGSPITSSGTLAFTYTGSTSQYIRGDGSLQTFPTTISGITADNGLTATSSTNVQLGGSLLATTTITGGSFGLIVTGSHASNNTFQATNTSSGTAVDGTSNSGVGVSAISTSNTGLQASSISGNAISGISTSGIPITITANPSSTSTVVSLAYFNRSTSGTAANGIGGSIDIFTETSAGSGELSNQLISKWTTATHGSRTSQFIIKGVNTTVNDDLFTLSGNGQVKLNKYGINTFSGTPAYAIGTDATGNLVEFAVPSTGISAVTADNGLTANTSSNVRLGGTLIQGTTINSNAFGLTLTGSVAGNSFTVVNNEVSGIVYGIHSTTTGVSSSGVVGIGGNAGVQGISTNGTGVLASSTNSYALSATSNGTAGANIQTTRSSTATVEKILDVSRNTTGTAANGIGGSIDFNIETTTGTTITSAQLISTWTNATHASRSANFKIALVNNTTLADKITLSSTGALRLHDYGVNTFGGVATYVLGVDASGNIVETATTAGANVSLSNLASVAINTSLLPGLDNNIDAGSPTVGFKDMYTRTVKFDGSTSGTATLAASTVAGTPNLTLPTVSGILVQYSDATLTSSGTITPQGSARENRLKITAQAVTVNFQAPTGPVDGNVIMIVLKDNGVSSTINWNSVYRGGTDIGLPSSTVAGKWMYIQFMYNSTDSRWDLIGYTTGI